MDLRSGLEPFIDGVRTILRDMKNILQRMKGNLFSLVGATIIIFFIGIALLAPVIAPPEPGADPYVLKLDEDILALWPEWFIPLPTSPSSDHPFGTLAAYDIYYGCIWGTRTAFRICLEVTLIALAVGLFIGCLAGYFGGLLDELLMRFTEIFFAFPSLLLAVLLVAVIPDEWLVKLGVLSFTVALSSLDKVILVLATTGWPVYARLIRGEVIKVKNEDYVEAAKAIGCSNFRIIIRHVLPNSIYPVVAMASMNIGGVVLLASTLSFLKVGIPLGYADWAPFIADSRDYMISARYFEYAYTFVIPGIFLTTFILGWTLLGDTLREVLDPEIRRR